MEWGAVNWDQALALLGEVLESRRAAPCHLIVCGGAALRAAAVASRLRISFIGRAGQIPLKMHAAVGRRETRDLDDLHALAPTADECRHAARWLRRTGLSAADEQRLLKILTLLGHGND